jgi:hypothetical protein
MLSRACGRYSAPKKKFHSDHRSQSMHRTHAADLMLMRWAITKRHEVVGRRAMARQQDLKETYRACCFATALKQNGYSTEPGHMTIYKRL